MILKYQTGEEIRLGDRVLFHGEPASVSLVVTDSVDRDTDWHMHMHGGGVQIREPKHFGLVFIPASQIEECEDLEFVSRSSES